MEREDEAENEENARIRVVFSVGEVVNNRCRRNRR